LIQGSSAKRGLAPRQSHRLELAPADPYIEFGAAILAYAQMIKGFRLNTLEQRRICRSARQVFSDPYLPPNPICRKTYQAFSTALVTRR
jgi:hypothetical protein